MGANPYRTPPDNWVRQLTGVSAFSPWVTMGETVVRVASALTADGRAELAAEIFEVWQDLKEFEKRD